ncbi:MULTISPECIES: ornithine carbamoyltransferase [unclassified Nitrospina]|uniref:ornithine carbamoyltransferase n=1 Tax=unclassified Nitrospina TaxID=2638683 RepID=UPI003F9C4E39
MDISLPQKDFLVLTDFTREQLSALLDLAEDMKRQPEAYRNALAGKSLGMIFHKQSTRTRISFEVGMFQMGGQALFFSPGDMQLSRGETIEDTARVLSRYLDAVMIRTFAYDDIVELAKHATIPIINGLTDFNHPCQALSDMMTIRAHFGKLEGLKLAYIGDGNNMAVSLLFACIRMGMHISIASPPNYTITPKAMEWILDDAERDELDICLTDNIEEAAKDADVVYTDVWASMGQEEERKKRLHDLADYTVDDMVMSFASTNAVFMHCLPAHRGEEVGASVIDGPASIVFDQAENRLHLQKAILYGLVK